MFTTQSATLLETSILQAPPTTSKTYELVHLNFVSWETTNQILRPKDHRREEYHPHRLDHVGVRITHRAVVDQVRSYWKDGWLEILDAFPRKYSLPLLVLRWLLLLVNKMLYEMSIFCAQVLLDLVHVKRSLTTAVIRSVFTLLSHSS